MEDLPTRLKALTHNKYFAYIAVIFFAFLTALVFALIGMQPQNSTTEQLQRQIEEQDRTGVNIRDSEQTSSQSPIDRIISAVTGKRSNSPDQNNDQDSNSTSTSRSQKDSNNKNRAEIPAKSNEEILIEKIEKEAIPLPKVSVDKYVLGTELPPKPDKVKIHKLKTHYSETEVHTFAKNLGFSPLTDPKVIIEKGEKLYQMSDLNLGHFLVFDSKTGAFVFLSDTGYTPKSASQNTVSIADAFISDINVDQTCLTHTDTFKKKSEPDATYEVYRCAWKEIGGPFVNTLGILNLPKETTLANVRIGDTTGFSPVDEDVIDLNDNNIFIPTDFNYMHVKVENGRVIEATSNILTIERTDTVSNVISPEQALANLNNNSDVNFAFAAPIGSGFVDFTDVYQNGEAIADEVTINDFELTYNIIPGSDLTYLCPKWTNIATGTLRSGYDSEIIQTLTAVSDPRCLEPTILGETTLAQINVPKAAPTERQQQQGPDDTLKYKDFTIVPPKADVAGCPDASTFTNAILVKPGVYIGWAAVKSKTTARDWYMLYTDKSLAETEIINQQLISSAQIEYLAFRVKKYQEYPRTSTTIGARPESLTDDSIFACVKLTTGSPSLYIYSDVIRNIAINVNPYGGVGYTAPAFTHEDGWLLTASPNKTLQFDNGATNHRAYWEYRRFPIIGKLLTSSLPNEGYVVKTEDLEAFITSRVARELELTIAETTDLLAEVRRETKNATSEYVRISLMTQEFIDMYLPVDIQPAPDVFYRYNLFITPATGHEVISEPILTPISRDGYVVVELGTLYSNK